MCQKCVTETMIIPLFILWSAATFLPNTYTHMTTLTEKDLLLVFCLIVQRCVGQLTESICPSNQWRQQIRETLTQPSQLNSLSIYHSFLRTFSPYAFSFLTPDSLAPPYLPTPPAFSPLLLSCSQKCVYLWVTSKKPRLKSQQQWLESVKVVQNLPHLKETLFIEGGGGGRYGGGGTEGVNKKTKGRGAETEKKTWWKRFSQSTCFSERLETRTDKEMSQSAPNSNPPTQAAAPPLTLRLQFS